jgi:LacI family transcriptional regulator
VPDEVAVLGVDNDEIITELSHPKLSSIQADTVSTGYKACVCLDKMMRGVKVSRAADHTAPLAAIERESTNTIATTDRLVAAGLRMIREEACGGVTVKQLVDRLSVSRSNLEVRFKQMLGRTIHDEITRVRLKRVRQLLYAEDDTLAQIAAKTGYLDISHMSRSSKKQFGAWPGEYRIQSRAKSGIGK